MRHARVILIPVVTVALVTVLRLSLEPVLHGRSPMAIYFIAILLSAWRAGQVAGLIATVLSLAAGAWLFVVPSAGDRLVPVVVQLTMFAVVALVIGWVTDRIHRSQREVVLREERFRSLVDATTSIVWTASPEGAFIERQASWEAYTGQPWEAHRGLGWHGALHPDDRATLVSEWERAIERQIPIDASVRLWHAASHTYRVFLVRAVPLFTAAGAVREWIGTCVDVDDQRRAEQALRASEAEFKAMFELAGGAKWQVDALTGRMLRANNRFCEFVGYPREEVLQKRALELTHADDREAVAHHMAALVGGERNEIAAEIRYIRKDGTVVWGHTAAAVLRDAAGRPTRLVASTQDVTGRKQQEQERERLLEREREARAAAEQANRLKDEFLATVSHELRTPLNAILGWADMLRSGVLDQTRHDRAVESIYGNARRQAQLIEDLLDVSRIITGSVRLQVAPLNFTDVVQAAVDVVAPAASARHIRVTVRSEAIVPMRGDAARLQQIVWNLLSNAVKFTHEDGTVDVRVERTAGAVILSVADNGMGIPAEFLPYVFDRFRQADSGTTRAFGGLGLGLAIVRHLAELHGGTVNAESSGPGTGATFRVVLPSIEAALPAFGARPAATPAVTSHDSVDLHGVRVLLVDDERDTRELLAVALTGYGASVEATGSVSEALDALATTPPDVLVSDIGMPGRDGYSLVDVLRHGTDPRLAAVPAIALTAYAKPEDRARSLAAGFQAHVVKPLEPIQLARTIHTLVRTASSRREAG